MGYDITVSLQVIPHDRFGEVADRLEKDHERNFGDVGEGVESWENDGPCRWSNLTEDMLKLSKDFPGVQIIMHIEGEDGAEWAEYFEGGKTYGEGRPDWTVPDFDVTKLKRRDYPVGSLVTVLDDGGDWRFGKVIGRDTSEVEGKDAEYTWTVEAEHVKGGKWISSDEDLIRAL